MQQSKEKNMLITGGCYCGKIRYKSTDKIQSSIQCHCRECQYITGGAPNTIIVVPDSDFSFTEGTPTKFKRDDLENPVTRFFCNNCGTGIGTKTPSRPGSMVLKVGTLDRPDIYEPTVAIFTIDKQAFHHIPDNIKAFKRRP
jgi:hypothetical protein